MTARASIIPIFVPHLGCPNDCVFCNQRKISGSLTAPNGEQVAAAIKQGLLAIPEKSNIQLAFYGGSFTAIPTEKQNELLGAALPFLREGSLSSVRLSTRPDAIDKDTLFRLKEFKVSTIELGAQSMCDEVLALSGRGHTAEQTETAARLIKKHGFKLILQMMTGLPGDTLERTIETANRIIAISPDGVRIYPTVIVENTPLYNMWRAGTYREHTVEEAADWCSQLMHMFQAAEIPIIRLGLNPTEELSAGAAAGGAYHPAFGELVRSRLLLSKARQLLSENEHGKNPVLGVNKAQISPMVGQRRENVHKLCKEFSLNSLKIRQAEVPENTIVLL